jgi:P27 family predicted phage terminase small subunit
VGRKRKPDAIKALAGTAQKCRMNPAAPAQTAGLPAPPEWLSGRAAELFHQIVATVDGMRIASADDVHMLAMLASRLEEIELCTGVIEDLGRTYMTHTQSGSEMFRTRPEVAQRNEAMRHAQSLLAEFGLSPATRSKVSVNKAPQDNPFAALTRALAGKRSAPQTAN